MQSNLRCPRCNHEMVLDERDLIDPNVSLKYLEPGEMLLLTKVDGNVHAVFRGTPEQIAEHLAHPVTKKEEE